MAATARVGKSGQVTMPAAIREEFGIKPGDTVIWSSDGTGRATVRPVKYTFEELRGIVPALETDKHPSEIIKEAREEWGKKKVREYEDFRMGTLPEE